MRDLVAVLFRRKWLILSIFLVAAVTVGLKTLRDPVTYSADATVLLNRSEVRTNVLERRGRSLPWVEVVESEVEVIRSLPVLVGAAERLGEPSDEFPEGLKFNYRQLQQRIKTGVLGESNVLAVSATERAPQVAVAIANAVAESYLQHRRELFTLPDASGQIRARADSTFQAMQDLQKRREGVFASFGHTDVDEEEQELVRRRMRLWAAVSQKEIDIRGLETAIADGRAYLASDLAVSAPPFPERAGGLASIEVAKALEALRRVRQDLSEARAKYTEQHPQVIDLRNQLAELIEDVHSGAERIVTVKEHELRVAQGDADELRSQIAEVDQRLAKLPALRNEIQALDARLHSASDDFEQLNQFATAAEINQLSASDEDVTLLSPAVGARRNQKGDLIRLILGPILALMAGVGLAFYLENLDHSLQNREDIERHLEIPVLASFPEVSMNEDGLDQQQGKRLPYQKGRARSR